MDNMQKIKTSIDIIADSIVFGVIHINSDTPYAFNCTLGYGVWKE